MDGGYKRMISNCSINEFGKISGGKPGDNNGKEWLISSRWRGRYKNVGAYTECIVIK